MANFARGERKAWQSRLTNGLDWARTQVVPEIFDIAAGAGLRLEESRWQQVWHSSRRQLN